jgi:tRNA A-37 threonylcarbamoyl transferase component Bud32
MSYFIKTILYDKNTTNAEIENEIELQKISANRGLSPKIIDYQFYEMGCIIKMENLNEMCLADKYGDLSEHITKDIWRQIHDIIEYLFKHEGIEYIDITPYNFIEKDGKVYIIDFGHAKYTDDTGYVNWFLTEFINDRINQWNPDFK